MTKRILLVDDEVEITEINKRYLTQAGYEVNVAHDGQEALELFQKYSIDLIITDIMQHITFSPYIIIFCAIYKYL